MQSLAHKMQLAANGNLICVAVHSMRAAYAALELYRFHCYYYNVLSVDQALNNKMNAIFHKLCCAVRWAIKAKNVCNISFVSNAAERTAVGG